MSWDVTLKAVNNNPLVPLNQLILSESVSIKNRMAIENLQTFGKNSYFYDNLELRKDMYSDSFCVQISSVIKELWNQATVDNLFGLILETLLPDFADVYDFQSVATFEEFAKQEWFGVVLKELAQNPLVAPLATASLNSNFDLVKNANGVQSVTGAGSYGDYNTATYTGQGVVLGVTCVHTYYDGDVFVVCDGIEGNKVGSVEYKNLYTYNFASVKEFKKSMYGKFKYLASSNYSGTMTVYYIPV